MRELARLHGRHQLHVDFEFASVFAPYCCFGFERLVVEDVIQQVVEDVALLFDDAERAQRIGDEDVTRGAEHVAKGIVDERDARPELIEAGHEDGDPLSADAHGAADEAEKVEIFVGHQCR